MAVGSCKNIFFIYDRCSTQIKHFSGFHLIITQDCLKIQKLMYYWNKLTRINHFYGNNNHTIYGNSYCLAKHPSSSSQVMNAKFKSCPHSSSSTSGFHCPLSWISFYMKCMTWKYQTAHFAVLMYITTSTMQFNSHLTRPPITEKSVISGTKPSLLRSQQCTVLESSSQTEFLISFKIFL